MKLTYFLPETKQYREKIKEVIIIFILLISTAANQSTTANG